jgi:putative transposase
MKVGEQKRIPLPANQEKQHCHVFGAYNWLNDCISWTLAERKNSESFIAFLEHLLVNEFPTGRVVLVLDRASYHKSAAARAALSLFEHRVLVIWLPAYCTELNPIERFWRHLKDLACANQLWSGLDKVIEAVETVLHQQNDPFHESRFQLSKVL